MFGYSLYRYLNNLVNVILSHKKNSHVFFDYHMIKDGRKRAKEKLGA